MAEYFKRTTVKPTCKHCGDVIGCVGDGSAKQNLAWKNGACVECYQELRHGKIGRPIGGEGWDGRVIRKADPFS